MKRIIWTIGVQKAAGNLIEDVCLHHEEPKILQLDGENLQRDIHYTYSPDFDGVSYSSTFGYLDFTLLGGLYDTMKLTVIW